MLNLRDLVLSAAAIYLLYTYVLYPIFISPLSKIPSAHPIASFSSLWILHRRYTFQENRTIYAAHQRHGSVVRLGPNELSVNCVDDGVRTIYAGGYEKHPWYHLFANYDDVPTMFSTVEGRPHAQRKRMISNLYAKSTLQSARGLAGAAQCIVHERLIPAILACLPRGSADAEGEIDLYRLFNHATMDLVTAYIFGLRSGSNFIQDTNTADWWLGLYQSRKKHVFWTQELPTLTKILARIGINLSPKWVAAANIQLEDWCLSLCDAAETCNASMTAAEEQAHPEDVPTIYRQLRVALATTAAASSPMTTAPPSLTQEARIATASELLDQLSAGHETSAITLTFLFHELSQDPALQTRLRSELLSAHPTLHHDPARPASAQPPLPTPKALDALPLLHAILMETLRLHPAIPGPQPRVTPPAAKSSGAGGVRLGAYGGLPAGTRVSSSPYSLHRESGVFADPERFWAERWLGVDEGGEATAATQAEMLRWFWAFSSGGRMCIGRHLAMLQMKMLVAVVVGNFMIGEVVDDSSANAAGGIRQEDAYTAQPEGKKLVVRLSKA